MPLDAHIDCWGIFSRLGIVWLHVLKIFCLLCSILMMSRAHSETGFGGSCPCRSCLVGPCPGRSSWCCSYCSGKYHCHLLEQGDILLQVQNFQLSHNGDSRRPPMNLLVVVCQANTIAQKSCHFFHKFFISLQIWCWPPDLKHKADLVAPTRCKAQFRSGIENQI